MRWALIESGIVANVVEQDDQPQIDGQWVECGSAGPRWLYDGEQFSAPPGELGGAVQTITSRQGKRALLVAGLYHDALAAINALPDPSKTAALIDWDAPTWSRNDPTLVSMAAVLGLTDEQLDELFAQASTL